MLPYAISSPLTRPHAASDQQGDRDHPDPGGVLGQLLGRDRGAPDRREGDDRADREVDAAADDHERHPDADDADDRRQPQDRRGVVPVGEPAPGRDGADDADQHQRDDEPGVAADTGAQQGEDRVGLSFGLERGLLDPRTVLAHARAPSMTRSRTFALVDLGGGGLVDDLALADDEDPVGETEHLLDLAGDDDDGDAAVGQRPDELVDLGAGADVDAAGGLVEQQHPAVAQQPAGEHDLLLVAAGEGAHGAGHAVGADVEAGGQLLGAPALLAAGRGSPAGAKRLMRRHRDVAVRPPRRAAAPGSCAPRGPGRPRPRPRPMTEPRRSRLPSTLTVPVAAPAGAVHVSMISERPAPTRPASPTISPACTVRSTPVNTPARREVPHLEHRRAPSARVSGRGGKTYSIERPVISLISSAVGVSGDGQAGGDGAAVLEHGDPVADLADLLQPVGDVDDGDVLGSEVADHPEEVLDLLLVEHRGRLVEDEQPGVAARAPGPC